MFWIISGIAVLSLFALYFTFSSLTGGSSQFEDLNESKALELNTFITRNLDCKSNLAYLRDYSGSAIRNLDFPSKDKIVVLSEESVGNGLLEINIEGRFDGQVVTFWIREGIQDGPDQTLDTPFILYLRGTGPYSDISKEESLLARPEFSIVTPYIFGESSTIRDFTSSYGNNSVTFQTYILAELISVMDYVEAVYNSPKVIVYGEAWGSVLGRELALIDERVDLVISSKFPGDPFATLVESGFYLEAASVNQVYLQDSVRCLPRGVTNFIDLVPSPHIYLGPSVYNSLYSVGTRELAGLLEQRYIDDGSPGLFSYIELEYLDHTYSEEVISKIYESLNSID